MSKAGIELIREGLQSTDPKELIDQMYTYCMVAKNHMLVAYHRGKDILKNRNPTEEDMKFVREHFNKAADAIMDAKTMFEPDCMLDLLDCED